MEIVDKTTIWLIFIEKILIIVVDNCLNDVD